MCHQCRQAVREQQWERLDEVAADPATNCWLTRCPVCGQLWETHAYHPHYSWELTLEQARERYPGTPELFTPNGGDTMTEAAWLACTEPLRMLNFLRGRVSGRQLRLFACACCRHVWPLLTFPESRCAVELAERSADEPIDEETLDLASGAAEWAYQDALRDDLDEDDPRLAAAEAASYASSPGVLEIDRHLGVVVEGAVSASPVGSERAGLLLAGLLRDIIGDPHRSASIPPDWLTPTVVGLATAAYGERLLPGGALEPGRLAVLGDALEDAGCDNGDLLDHLRKAAWHVRGCWILDRILGKE